MPPWLLLFGGSFNPPHIGHMRIAIETMEALNPQTTLFVPAAVPPHKPAKGLLPFALRCAMLEAALNDMVHMADGGSGVMPPGMPPGMSPGMPPAARGFAPGPHQGDDPPGPRNGLLPGRVVNCEEKLERRDLSGGENVCTMQICRVEDERKGPSYTIDTLRIMAARNPQNRLVFLMGSEDYERVNTWHGWSELPLVADLAVLPRAEAAEEHFGTVTRTLWPEAAPTAPPCPGVSEAYALPGGGRFLLIPQPVLEISATLIRERFLTGKRLDFLVPPGVAACMRQHQDTLTACWR